MEKEFEKRKARIVAKREEKYYPRKYTVEADMQNITYKEGDLRVLLVNIMERIRKQNYRLMR
uniref:Uncharacterized protein n=1 Tax=viral metagenome TaxID=1070528 RepID=A0A6H1Z7B6_9ZZZZ